MRREAQALLDAPTVPRGQRSDAIFKIMYLRGEQGWTNHQILTEAEALGRRWGKYTRANLFADWSAMLSMLSRVRRVYPSPRNGNPS